MRCNVFPFPTIRYQTIIRVFFALVWAWLVAPWVALAVAGGVVHFVWRAMRAASSLRYALSETLRCPAGHTSELQGVFECRSCGSLFAGWAFQACPTCGESCGYVSCEHCGLAVRNPFLRG